MGQGHSWDSTDKTRRAHLKGNGGSCLPIIVAIRSVSPETLRVTVIVGMWFMRLGWPLVPGS